MAGGSSPPHDMASSMAALFSHLSDPKVITSILRQTQNPTCDSSIDVPIEGDPSHNHTMMAGDSNQHASVCEPPHHLDHSAAVSSPQEISCTTNPNLDMVGPSKKSPVQDFGTIHGTRSEFLIQDSTANMRSRSPGQGIMGATS